MKKLFHGKNQYLSLRAVHSLLDNEYPDTDVIRIEAENTKAEKIIDSLYSNSLFTTPRVYFLKRVYKNKEKDILINNLLEIMDKISQPILIWEDQKVRSNTKYYKFFKDNKALEEFSELNKRTFITWARKEVERESTSFNTNIINILSERSNYDPERFVNNLNKIKLSGSTIIEEQDLNTIVTDTLETDIWKLMDSINKSNVADINKKLENLLQRRVDPHYILTMIARNLRISIQTKYLLDKVKSSREIASTLKLPPFAIYPIISSLENIDMNKILLQYQKLSNLDYEIKVGRIDPVLGLSLFTLIL